MSVKINKRSLYDIIEEHIRQHDDGERHTLVSVDVATLVVITGNDPRLVRKYLYRLIQSGVLVNATSPEKGGWREKFTTSQHFDDVTARRFRR